MKTRYWMVATLVYAGSTMAAEGFVALPKHGFEKSAYIICNPTGNFGAGKSELPNNDSNNACSVTTSKLIESPMNAPIEGFSMKGMLVRGVAGPSGGSLATVTDTIWRNKENTECILGTHVEMSDVPLSEDRYFEVNDIVRGGFMGKDLEVAYFFRPPLNADEENIEALFRVGRTFSSVRPDIKNQLPTLANTLPKQTAFNSDNAAPVSENWVDFTTDISYKDLDGITRKMTPMLYLKYKCDARDPVEKEGAVRLRTTGQGGNDALEFSISGLVPIEGTVEQY